MKKLHLLLIGVALALPTVAQATIIGSPHDFSTNSWNTRRGVCSPCHTAHHTDPAQLIPLWAHKTTEATFVPYNSPTMQASDRGSQPSGASKACLSCHDGTVAINQSFSGAFIGGASAGMVHEAALIGTDLHTTHPISFTYNDALAAADGFLYPPTSTLLQWTPGTGLAGKTIDQALLTNGKMECSSCHDVHKQIGSSATSRIMVKISGNDANGRGSLICRTCHDK
jgi:hypothetical protein